MALTAATDTGQAPLPGMVAAGSEPGGMLPIAPTALAVLGARDPVGGSDGVTPEPGMCRLTDRTGPSTGTSRVRDFCPTALASLSSRSDSNPDLLDVAGRPRGGRHVLRPSGPRPATIVRVPSGFLAVAFRPGNADGPPRRTAIPLFARSC